MKGLFRFLLLMMKNHYFYLYYNTGRNCVDMDISRGSWRTVSCEVTRPVICQKKQIPKGEIKEPPSPCDKIMVITLRSYYFIVSEYKFLKLYYTSSRDKIMIVIMRLCLGWKKMGWFP